MTDINNSLCRWSVSHTQTVGMFSRQAIAMLWDFAENNVFNHAAGDFITSINSICKVLDRLPTCRNGIASQKDAALLEEDSIVISTDPPYYDNINYADLSDFFYVWLRRTLKPIYSQLFSTMLVPKSEELVASEWRFKNKSEAKKYFENGMLQAFKQMRKSTSANYPLTVYYAYKQSETDETEGNMQTVSSGWETMLQATINAGFSITGTWPLRTERTVRVVAIETNALASSIALVCRPRPDDAPFTTRRAFLTELREALKVGLHNLQSGNIAPVDLAQASIGPGMAVYSKYKEILEADGTPMSVRNALVLINQELDAYLSEQESSMDTDSRFCIAWFEQFGLSTGEYGRAETLAKAKMAHMQALVDDGVLESGRGKVRLKKRNELPEKWSADRENTVWTIVQHLCHSLDTDGIPAAAQIVLDVGSSHAENAKALSYRAYIAAERKGWTEEALAYNRLVTAWPEIIEKTDELRNKPAEQLKLNM